MKRLFTFIAAMVISFNLTAQTNLTEAVDFNTTDSHGNPVHLFEILDKGQAVLIDFFFLNCGDCVATIPYIEESYHAFGCNTHDVFYMEISPYDDDAACQTWIDRYGIEYPTIGTSGGGMDILQAYGVYACPTTILITPDRQIVMQDLWPINNTQTVIDALESHGIEQHDCFPTEQFLVTPDSLHLYFHGCSPHGEIITVANLTSEDVVINRCYSENFRMECLYEGENIAETGMIVPLGETIELETFAWPNTQKDSYGILNIDTDLGIYTIVIYYESTYDVQESQASFSLMPNPANDYIKIEGKDLGTVGIYNALGQKVEEYNSVGSDLRISTSHYSNGIYFVRTVQGAKKRFIVAH